MTVARLRPSLRDESATGGLKTRESGRCVALQPAGGGLQCEAREDRRVTGRLR